ncbi:hypothetical protein BC834DRAFT_974045 [Gloeopeniophorella convolvens]|nr:hypothetical protein BC834DRAFT_974045 [Gloeopeniophorella convolvens]
METGAGLTLEQATALRFPPFPRAPDGVQLIPFSQFKPSGIRVPIDDDDDFGPERDGLGILTVPLRVKHAADNADKKKRKKKKGGAPQVQVVEKPKTWWETWEELEEIRANSYNINMPAVDRLSQAGADFKSGRPWPASSLGVHNMWDLFRIYIGLLQQPTITAKDAILDAEVGLDDVDTDSDDADEGLGGLSGDGLMERFLNDPEQSVKVFFSSYFRERGFIWSEPRCIAMPILVSFFLRYLIRSRVFPEPEYERPIKRALEIVEIARVQLPDTWKMGRALPDAFSSGCRNVWGSKQPPWIPSVQTDAPRSSTDEPEAKRQKLDADAQDVPGATNAQGKVATDAPSGGWGSSAPDARADGGWGSAATEAPPGDGWGSTDAPENGEGWGNAAAEWDPADANVAPAHVDDPLPPIWDPSLVEAPATWDLEPTTLLPLMGPTMFPLTHVPGVVEQSTRRIVRVEPPSQPRILAQGASAAEAVEEELAQRFAKLVLAPWERLDPRAYAAGSDVLPPTVLETSRGATTLEEADEAPGVHRPWKDEISVLVEPKWTEILIPGMGLGAIWIELVRDTEAGGAEKKKSKGKKKDVPKYWYMEQLVHQLPSYYIDELEEL